MPKVTFKNENQEIEVAEGTSIREAAKQLKINTNQGINGIGAGINKFVNCQGFGQCGTCRVFVTEGHIANTNGQTLWEKKCFQLPFPDPIPLPTLIFFLLSFLASHLQSQFFFDYQ